MGLLKIIAYVFIGMFILSTIINLIGGPAAAADSTGIIVVTALFVLWAAHRLYSGMASDYVDIAKEEAEEFRD